MSKLYLVATPIGNLDDMTIRGLSTLESVDLIAAEDTRRTLKLLNHFNIKKPLISYYEHNMRERGEKILAQLNNGKTVALVSDAGTPAISDPGAMLVAQCIENNIEVIPIPGAVAFVNALIVSGMDTGRFAFEGFLPVNKRSRKERLEQIANDSRTLIFYEAPHKLQRTLTDLLVLGDRKVAIIKELTKLHETKLYTTLQQAVDYFTTNNPVGEFVIVLEGSQTKPTAFWEEFTIHEHLSHYINEGMPEKQAMKAVAKDRNIAKTLIYRHIHLKPE